MTKKPGLGPLIGLRSLDVLGGGDDVAVTGPLDGLVSHQLGVEIEAELAGSFQAAVV